jgi:hypothetical protein
MADSNADLRALLETLDPKARDDLRRVLIRDQADRDAISSRLMRYRDQNGDDWADIIDMLTMHPDEGPEGGTAAWRDGGRRDILILGLSTLCSSICG